MSGISFKNVEEAKESTMTRAGVIDVFDIKEVKFETTKNKGTYYMGVNFVRKGDGFNHSFFLSEKALPRVKSLVKYATGKVLEDELLEEQLIKMLTGQKIALKVTGKIDESTGRAFPDLSFGGFGALATEVGKLEFTDQEKDKNALAAEAYKKGNVADADAATGAPAAAAPGTAAAKKDDDNPF